MMPKLFTNDNGTVREIAKLFVNDNGIVRRLQKLFVNAGGTVRLIFEDIRSFVRWNVSGEAQLADSEVVDFNYSGTRSNVITPGQAAMNEMITVSVSNNFDGGEEGRVEFVSQHGSNHPQVTGGDLIRIQVGYGGSNNVTVNSETPSIVLSGGIGSENDNNVITFTGDDFTTGTYTAAQFNQLIIDSLDGKTASESGNTLTGTISASLGTNSNRPVDIEITFSGNGVWYAGLSSNNRVSSITGVTRSFAGDNNTTVFSPTLSLQETSQRVSINFDPDTSSDNGDVAWNITNWSPDTDNVDDTEFLRQFANKILDTDAADTFTWDSEFSESAGTDTTLRITFDPSSFTSDRVSYVADGESFFFMSGTNQTTSADFVDSILAIFNAASTSDNFSITKVNDNELLLSYTGLITNSLGYEGTNSFAILGTNGSLSQTGSALTAVSSLGSDGELSVTLNSGISSDFESSVTVTENDGANTAIALTAQNGAPGVDPDGMHSTYTVTDYAGMEVTSFTSSVDTETATDSASVLSSIFNAINSNTETPIDFTADTDVASRLRLTAAEVGAIDGSWSISVNNHGQTENPGNITYTGPTVVTEGQDATEITVTSPDGVLTVTGGTDSDSVGMLIATLPDIMYYSDVDQLDTPEDTTITITNPNTLTITQEDG